jgi:hypothetical protein
LLIFIDHSIRDFFFFAQPNDFLLVAGERKRGTERVKREKKKRKRARTRTIYE